MTNITFAVFGMDLVVGFVGEIPDRRAPGKELSSLRNLKWALFLLLREFTRTPSEWMNSCAAAELPFEPPEAWPKLPGNCAIAPAHSSGRVPSCRSSDSRACLIAKAGSSIGSTAVPLFCGCPDLGPQPSSPQSRRA